MNLDLNSYIPSETLEELDLLNYINARHWFDHFGDNKEKLYKRTLRTMEEIPHEHMDEHMIEKHKKKFFEIIDLAHKDYLDEQKEPGSWNKA